MNAALSFTDRYHSIRFKRSLRIFNKQQVNIAVTILLCLVFTFNAWAQTNKELNKPELFIKSFFTMPSLSMSINSQPIEPVWLDPNRIWSMGMGVDWRSLSASFAVRTPAQVNDVSLFGETDYFDFQLQLYRKQWNVDSFFQSYQGFFLRDLSIGCVRGAACSLRPELRIQHAGILLHYIIDPHWSMQAAFSPPAQPILSAGSWFVSAGFDRLKLSNNSSLVDGLEPRINGGRFSIASIAPGYGYTWVKQKWAMSSALYMGGGLMAASYYNTQETDTTNIERKLALKAGAKLALAYGGNTRQAGVRYFTDTTVTRIKGIDLNWISQSIELYLGRRF